MTIEPTADQVRALRDGPADGAIVMTNLLKFKAAADYPDDHDGPRGDTGEAAYDHYQHAFTTTLFEVTQAQILFAGPVGLTFIGVAGAPETDWDRVLIVRYPSKGHFLGMMANADYQRALVHRRAGLARTVLLQSPA
ncbi:MAG: DUF1330 domain-containing protein [Pseudomonadota bacterium]